MLLHSRFSFFNLPQKKGVAPPPNARHEPRASARRLHALVRRGAPHGHGGLADFVNTLLGPEWSLPLRIVERLAQYQRDKALGLYGTQRLNEGTKAAYTDFGI